MLVRGWQPLSGAAQHVAPVSPGIIEGFKVEKASLQEALGQKEEAERGLVVELESLSQQLQQGTRQLAELKEKNAVLLCEKEAAAAEAQEREAGRRAGGSLGASVSGLKGDGTCTWGAAHISVCLSPCFCVSVRQKSLWQTALRMSPACLR